MFLNYLCHKVNYVRQYSGEKQNRPHCSFPMTAFKVNTKTFLQNTHHNSLNTEYSSLEANGKFFLRNTEHMFILEGHLLDLLQLHKLFFSCWFSCHSSSFEICVTQENMSYIQHN